MCCGPKQHHHTNTSLLFAITYVLLILTCLVITASLWFMYQASEPDSIIQDVSGFAIFACMLWIIQPLFLLFDYRGYEAEEERTIVGLGVPFVYSFVGGLAYLIDFTVPSVDRPLVCVCFVIALIWFLFILVLLHSLVQCLCARKSTSAVANQSTSSADHSQTPSSHLDNQQERPIVYFQQQQQSSSMSSLSI